jgi:hypothetical protein
MLKLAARVAAGRRSDAGMMGDDPDVAPRASKAASSRVQSFCQRDDWALVTPRSSSFFGYRVARPART